MSSRREVLIRILALLQGKTLIETAHWKSHMKMLKKALFDCALNEKMLQCWRRTGHLPSFFFFLTAQESPPKAIQGKKMLTLGGQPGWRAGRRWNWLMHNLEAPWILRATTLLHLLYFSVNSGIKTLFLILNTCYEHTTLLWVLQQSYVNVH